VGKPGAGALLGITAGTIWGGMFVIGKSALDRVDAFHLTTIRYGIAGAVFLAILWAVEGRTAFRLEGRGVRLWLLGSLGFAGFNLLAFTGLDHARPESAALIVAATPLATALILWLRTHTAPSRGVLATFAIALVGVFFVVTHGAPASIAHGSVGWGDGLVLAGVISFVFYTLGAGEFRDFSPLRYTALTAGLGWLTLAAATLAVTLSGWKSEPSAADVWAVTPQIAYITILGAVVAVLAWNAAVGSIGAQNTALFVNLVPIVAFTIQVARGYRPAALEIVGAVVTILALVAANLLSRPRTKRPVVVTQVPGAEQELAKAA
jgi:drug/metabolite transporter (DMT)-like permease